MFSKTRIDPVAQSITKIVDRNRQVHEQTRALNRKYGVEHSGRVSPYDKASYDAELAEINSQLQNDTRPEIISERKTSTVKKLAELYLSEDRTAFNEAARLSDLDEAKAPTGKHIANTVTGVDHVEKHKDGTYTARREFFYSHGATSEGFSNRVSDGLHSAGMKHEILDHGRVDKPFKGGGTTKQNSHFWVKFKLHNNVDEERLDEMELSPEDIEKRKARAKSRDRASKYGLRGVRDLLNRGQRKKDHLNYVRVSHAQQLNKADDAAKELDPLYKQHSNLYDQRRSSRDRKRDRDADLKSMGYNDNNSRALSQKLLDRELDDTDRKLGPVNQKLKVGQEKYAKHKSLTDKRRSQYSKTYRRFHGMKDDDEGIRDSVFRSHDWHDKRGDEYPWNKKTRVDEANNADRLDETRYEHGISDSDSVRVRGVKHGMKSSKPFDKKFKTYTRFQKWAESDAAADHDIHQVEKLGHRLDEISSELKKRYIAGANRDREEIATKRADMSARAQKLMDVEYGDVDTLDKNDRDNLYAMRLKMRRKDSKLNQKSNNRRTGVWRALKGLNEQKTQDY